MNESSKRSIKDMWFERCSYIYDVAHQYNSGVIEETPSVVIMSNIVDVKDTK